MHTIVGQSAVDEFVMIENFLNGDLEAFNQLVLTYHDVAYRVSYRILKDEVIAEDVVQDSFFSVYRNLRSFRGGSFKAWLLRIVTNACYDEIRHQKRCPAIPLYPNDSNGEEIENPNFLLDSGASPEATAIMAEQNFTIRSCLNSLDEDFRQVVVLVDLWDMSYAEAAKVIGVPLGTIKSRLKRAREKLKVSLHDCDLIISGVF